MRHLMLAISLVGLVIGCLAFMRNDPYRDGINGALGELQIPERMLWGYTVDDLQKIVARLKSSPATDGQTQLDIYVRPVLYWNDIVFAIALAVFSASLWLWILEVAQPAGLLRYLIVFFMVSAVLYGVSDVAEDVLLARLFVQPKIAVGEAWMACQLTRIKIATNAASVTSGAVFMALKYYSDRKPGPKTSSSASSTTKCGA